MDVAGTFGAPGRPAGVDDHAGLVRVRVHGRARGGLRRHHVLPPHVSSRRPGDAPLGALRPVHHQHPLHAGGTGHGVVRHLLHLHQAPAAEEAVRGDQQPGPAVCEAGGHGPHAVAGEDGGEDGPDAGAGQDGQGALQGEGHEDAHPIPPAHTQAEQGIGHPLRLRQGRPIRECARPAVLSLPEQGGRAGPPGCHPTIQGLGAVVVAGTGKPAGPGQPRAGVQHRPRGPCPGHTQGADHRIPEPGRIGGALPAQVLHARAAVPAGELEEPAALQVHRFRMPGEGRSRGVHGGHPSTGLAGRCLHPTAPILGPIPCCSAERYTRFWGAVRRVERSARQALRGGCPV